MVKKDWGHDELATDLARHLVTQNRMIWENMQLGPAASPRPDVFTIEKSYVRPAPTVYECKVSVSDFRADATEGKWQAYLEYAHRVMFAVPAGLISKSDVPQMCGLIVRHENGWRLAKAATVNPHPIAEQALLKLLIDGVNREGPPMRARRWHNENTVTAFAKKFGNTAARYVADATQIERTLEHAESQRAELLRRADTEAAAIRAKATAAMPQLWQEMLTILALQADADAWRVRAAIQELRTLRTGTPEQRALRTVLVQLRHTLRSHEHFLEEKPSDGVQP